MLSHNASVWRNYAFNGTKHPGINQTMENHWYQTKREEICHWLY